VNSLDCYSCRLIGKLTAFLQLQELSLRSKTVDYSTSAARRSRSPLKAKVGSTLAKAAALRINLNVDGVPITSKTHTHPSHSQTSRLLTSSLSLGSSSPSNPVYARRVDFSALVFSLSSHRHSYIGLVFSSRFLDS
jgi:hypothetical protein